MCGFVICSKDKFPIKESLKLIKHRGPDSLEVVTEDNLAFGFARLSIIDLEKRSNQPFRKDNNLVMTFNGEIYNYKELRKLLQKEGIVFYTESDTEVIYEAFKQWGNNCFNRLEGMFSVAFYNVISKELVIARDHLGIKPLYYSKSRSDILIASELKVFMSNGFSRVNTGAIKDYLCYGIHFSNATLLQDVFEVPPGTYVILKPDIGLEIHQYFNLKNTFDKSKSFSKDELFNKIDESIKFHSQADVEIGLQASGGLDSSVILANLYRRDNGFKSFSIDVSHPLLSERKWQNHVIEKFPHENKLILFKKYSVGELVKEMSSSTYFHDLPIHHPNIIPSDKLNALARSQNVKVLLSGDGADEVFCGYPWHLFDGLNIQNSAWIPFQYFDEMIPSFPSSLNLQEVHYGLAQSDYQTYFDQRYYIQKWFHRQDRSGMRSSVEIRVPFATTSLVSELNSLSLDIKTKNYKTAKKILKNYAERYFDDSFIYRKKVGFSIPINDWYSKELFTIRTFEILEQFGLLNKKVRFLINEGPFDKYSGRLLWSLLSFAVWVEEFDLS